MSDFNKDNINSIFLSSLTVTGTTTENIKKYGSSIFFGYANTTSPHTATRHTVFFRTKLSTVSDTRVGIRIPTTRSSSYPSSTSYVIGDTTKIGLGVWQSSVVGDDPDWLSNTGIISGFSRGNWVSEMEGNDIVIYTTNSTQKSALNTTEDYWFGFQTRDESNNFFHSRLQPSNIESVDKSICNFRSYQYLNLGTFTNGNWIIPGLRDYND